MCHSHGKLIVNQNKEGIHCPLIDCPYMQKLLINQREEVYMAHRCNNFCVKGELQPNHYYLL